MNTSPKVGDFADVKLIAMWLIFFLRSCWAALCHFQCSCYFKIWPLALVHLWCGLDFFYCVRMVTTLWISFWEKQHVVKSWRIKSGSNVGWWEFFRCEKKSFFCVQSDTNYKFVWCKYFVSDSSGNNTAALTVCHWGTKEVCPWSRSTAECYLWGWTLGTLSLKTAV